MDPQQRLVLELAWEALEDARIAPDRAARQRGRRVRRRHLGRLRRAADRAGAEPGRHALHRRRTAAIIANRVSYFLGLRGPSLTVDAGQSSSLVAVHLACESLRRGETALALAGGVNLNLLPETTDGHRQLRRAVAGRPLPHLRRRANGYVRGEGGGVVVLKPLRGRGGRRRPGARA